MHPALLKLMRLQFKGWIRRQFTGGSGTRKVFAALGFIFFLIWLVSASIGMAFHKPLPAESILGTLPVYLTAFALLPLIFGNDDRAIAFTPAEIDFLFPGPFSRRHLVVYKMVKLVLGSIAGGLIFSLWMRSLAGTIATAIVGSTLSLVFINLFTTVIALGRDYLDERRYTWARRAVTAGVIGAGAWIAWSTHDSGLPFTQRLQQLSESGVVRTITAPARVFAHVFAARTWAEFWPWCGACLGMIGGAAGLVLVLDRGYLEAALAASQRRQSRIARMGRGGVGALEPGKPVKAVRLPTFAALGGAGAIVRRQLITAVRTSRGWMAMFLVAGAYGFFISRVTGKLDAGHGSTLAGLLPGMVMMLIMLPQMLRFDFRGDLDHLDWIKTLPLSAGAVAMAELATPVAVLTLLGWVIAGGVAAFMNVAPGMLVMSALGITPLAVLVIGLENFTFLVMPTRLFGPGQASMQFSGRRILMALSRLLLLGIGGGVVAGVGAAAWALSESVPVTYAACWAALSLIGAGLVTAVAWAFRRFDVSLDMPT